MGTIKDKLRLKRNIPLNKKNPYEYLSIRVLLVQG